jgi:hypothetical protein
METWPKTAEIVKKRAIQRHKYFLAMEKDLCKEEKLNLKNLGDNFKKPFDHKEA